MVVFELGGGKQIDVVEAERDNAFDKKQMARIFIRRGELDSTDYQAGVTEAYLKLDAGDSNADAEMGGIIKDVDRSGSTTEILLESFERLMIDAEPTGPSELYGPKSDDESSGVSDNTIITDAISATPGITAGTVENLTSTIGISFNNATQAKKVREVASITGAAIRFNPDKTLDYKDRIGSDRTTVLKPGNQNIRGDFSADRQGGVENRVTHLRVIGAGEGEGQIRANVVPNDDSSSYENEVRYNNDNWSDGDPKKWFTESNKSIDRTNAIKEYGQTLINDLSENEYIDVQTTIEGVSDVILGDVFPVEYPEEDVGQSGSPIDMQVVELTVRYEETGRKYDVTLSTRRESREDAATEDRRDIQRFNQASQGVAVPINASGGRQPVDANNDYEMRFYYPDEVIEELRLNVRVMGLPYRAYSRGSASAASEIDNEVPFDVSYGGDSRTIERFRYPGVGEADLVEDPTVYDEGNGADRFDSFIPAGLSDNVSFGDKTQNLNVRSEATSLSGDGSVTAASWAQLDTTNVDQYSGVEVDWEANMSTPSANDDDYVLTVAVGVGGATGGDLVQTDDDITVSPGSSDSDFGGFSRRTDSFPLNEAQGREPLRVFALASLPDSGASVSTPIFSEVTVYRLEFV